MGKFVHLHGHSTFSFLDGYGTPAQIADRIKELGHDACAITDHGNVFAHVPYQRHFTKMGIKPIFGCEFYVTDDLHSREGTPSQLRGVASYPHVTVLATNRVGYGNLLKLSRLSYEEGFYHKPRVDWDHIAKYQDGLVVLSGCLGGFPSGYLKMGRTDECERFLVEQAARIEHFYVEIIPEPDMEESRNVTPWLIHLAMKNNLKLVMTADAHFPRREDYEVEDLMFCVGIGKKLSDDRGNLRLPEYQFYCDEDQLIQRGMDTVGPTNLAWKPFLELACDNTRVISDMCNVEIPKASKVVFPGLDPDETSDDLLWSWAIDGLVGKWDSCRMPDYTNETWYKYEARLRHEFEVLKRKGFCDYMLAIIDVVRWMKDQNHLVMCRGSAGGSLLLWATGASETDPMVHKLSFERFYDDNRPDPPDIDIDFEASARQDAIDYVFEKYGHENCSQLAALSRLKPKSALQDACSALGIPRSEYAAASSFLEAFEEDENGSVWPLQHPTVNALIQKYPKLKIIEKMVGQYRQASIHAAGVLVSSVPLAETIGIVLGSKKQPVAAVDKYGAADLGFLKMDFLSVDVLDVLKNTLDKIGQTPDWLYGLPLDDPLTIETGKRGLLAGIFQLDGTSAWRVSQEIGIDSFEDLVNASALCRPGPGDWVETYTTNKHDPIAFEKYLASMHPIAADILRDTWGIMLYQEQVMRFAREMAGFGWPEVHKLRKGITSSLGDEFMQTYHDAFVNGCRQTSGLSEEEATRWWKQILTHGGYSFNASHCVTYGITSYWSLYLKTHYPGAFYEAFLALEGKASTPNEMLMKRLIREFIAFGGNLIPLDPVHSGTSFQMIDERTMIGGFMNFKGVGEATCEKILAKGPFTSWDHFLGSLTPSVAARFSPLSLPNPDPQDVLQIAPWYAVQSYSPGHEEWMRANGVMPLSLLAQGYKFDADPVVGGYVVHTSFSPDKIIFMIEDKFNSVVARLPAKDVRRFGDAYRQMKVGDFVAVTGWWKDGVLYCKGMNIISRKEKTVVSKPRKSVSKAD